MISLKQKNQIIKLYQSGLTVDEIKVKLNIGRDVVYYCLKINKIKKRPAGHRKGKPSWNKGMKLTEKQKKKLNMEGLKLGLGWNKGKAGIYSEETIQKMRESHVGKNGSKSSNWQGGISFEPYGIEFNNELKSRIRARDNNQCQMLGCEIYENGKCHAVHHIDYCKKNNKSKNLITLCNHCHMKTNGNRDYWEKLFQNIQIQRGVN